MKKKRLILCLCFFLIIWVILFTVAYYCDKYAKSVACVNNRMLLKIPSAIECNVNKPGFINDELKEIFDYTELKLDGNEILYHLDLKGKNEFSGINGYVQVWKLSMTPNRYLINSKKYMSASVYDLKECSEYIRGREYIKWEYYVKKESAPDEYVRQMHIFGDGENMSVVMFHTPVSILNTDQFDKLYDLMFN